MNDSLAENRFNYERVNATDQVDPTSTEWPVKGSMTVVSLNCCLLAVPIER